VAKTKLIKVADNTASGRTMSSLYVMDHPGLYQEHLWNRQRGKSAAHLSSAFFHALVRTGLRYELIGLEQRFERAGIRPPPFEDIPR